MAQDVRRAFVIAFAGSGTIKMIAINDPHRCQDRTMQIQLMHRFPAGHSRDIKVACGSNLSGVEL